MDFVQTLYGIAKDICRPIARCLCYAISLPKKFTELSKRLTNLCQVRDDIKDKIDRVKLEKGPTRECNGWIAEVDKIEEEVKKIEEQHLVNKRCLKGCFPDVIARVRVGEDVEEMIERVKELQEKSKFETGFLTDLPIAKVETMPVPPKLGAEALIRRTLQKILDHMRDEQIQKIGIWGKGGVGKTTLMKLLNNEVAEIRQMFEVVIWVTISKSWSIGHVQDEVAERLSLKIKNDSNERFSDERVRKILSLELEGKKYLLLLDDVWEFINLGDVGVPSANQNNGCKVVLTTREFRVCRQMETDAEINVEALPKEEAWKMFESIVGRDIAILPTIQPIAQEIVRKCGGLPLAIKVVGGALRKEKDDSIWRNLLRKLNSPDSSYDKDMSDNVFTTLKASYDHLDPNRKKHYLYCGLYPEDHEIKKSQLIRYWRAEGLLSSECSLAEAGDEGRTILRDLVDASQLEKCEDDNHVKMHDVIRDFVLNLTSPDGGEKTKHVVRAGLSKQEIVVDGKEWEEASRISFINAKGYSLPDKPNCPNLLTLLLQSENFYSSSLRTIPESFFNHMPSLQVLDLSGSGIRSLPSSISNLVSLRALLLKRCLLLEELPCEINALKRLEVLYVSRHNMKNLDSKIWELTSLKCLKLETCKIGQLMKVMIPSGKISKLSQLEQFTLSWHIWIGDEGNLRVVAKELSSLARLSSLVFNFRYVNNLTLFLENSKAWRDQSIKKFKFTVGDYAYFDIFCFKNKRGLDYGIDEGGSSSSSIVSSVVLRDVIKRSDFLCIGRIGKLLAKLSDLGVENISGLKACGIWGCDYLETLADEDGLQEDAFANLEHLKLIQLIKLRSIFFCEISPIRKNMPLKDNFKSLRILNVDCCPMLKQLFSSRGLLLQLLNLEHVEILCCMILEEMISVDDCDVDEINSTSSSSSSSWVEYWSPLPKLKYLGLECLDEFVSIFSNSKRIILPLRWPSLEEVLLTECPKLKRYLFGTADDLPQLKILEFRELPEFVGFGEEGDVPYSCCLPSLLELRLVDCPILESFPLGPHNLPKLKRLKLYNLPQLVSFGNRTRNDNNNNASSLCWESLKVVQFCGCPKLKIFPFSVHSAPNLEKIGSDEELKWQDDATKLRFTPLMVSAWQLS